MASLMKQIVAVVLTAGVFGCGVPSSPVSTPQSGLGIYVNQVNAFSDKHRTTLTELNSTIKLLADESNIKADFGKQNLSGFLSISANSSAEALFSSLDELQQLSNEEKAALWADKAKLDALLTKVKHDQIELLRIVPPEGVTSTFHVQAMAAIDQETAVLISLISFYSSPGIQNKTSEFDRFPSEFSDATAGLRLANQRWNNAVKVAEKLRGF